MAGCGQEQPVAYVRWTICFSLTTAIAKPRQDVGRALMERRMLRRELTAAGDLIVFASAISIYIIAFLFLGEGRYRISYDGFMLLLSARAFFNGEAKPIFASQEKHTS